MFDDNENQQQMMRDEDDRDRRGSSGGKFGLFVGLVIMGILLFPATIIAIIHFVVLFMKGKQRISVIGFINVIELLIFTPLALHSHFGTAIKLAFTGNGLGTLFNSGFLWSMVLGVVMSYIYTALKALQFKRKPAVLAVDTWQHNFTYRDTPWVVFKKKFLQEKLQKGEAYSETGSPVGLLESPIAKREREVDPNALGLRKYDPQIVYRSYHDAVRQTIVTGQTGSGKSVALLSLIYNDILNGFPICMVDFKKSADVLYFLSKWAKENNRDFYYFTNGEGKKNEFYGEQATYDPLSTGDQTSKADFILNLREWDASADVYKQRTQEILQGVLYALQEVPHDQAPDIDWNSGNLKQLISALELNNMYDLVNYLSKEYKAGKLDQTSQLRVANFMSNYKEMADKRSTEGKALREQLSGIRTVCNKLVMSSYGKWLMEGSSSKHIKLLDIASDKKAPIVLFAFSAQEEPDFAKSMGQVIMSDLNRVSAAKTGMNDKNYFGVYVDEFQTLNPKFIADLLAKARSAGFFITIASQSLEQISAAATDNADATLQSILDVCGNYLFLKGAKQDSAERMAKIMGQTKYISRRVNSNNNSGMFNLNPFNSGSSQVMMSTEDNWVVAPSAFQDLKDAGATDGKYSEAYFISTAEDQKTRKKENAAQKLRIIAQKDILGGPSPEFLEFIKKQTYNQIQSNKNVSAPIKNPDVDEQSSNVDPFAALKTAKMSVPNEKVQEHNQVELSDDELVDDFSDDAIDKNIDAQFEKIDSAKDDSTDTDKKNETANTVVGFDPVFDTQPKKIKSEEPKQMTTFERIQFEKKQQSKRVKAKKEKADLTPRDEPELLSRSIEKIPQRSKTIKDKEQPTTKNKFTLPKL